MKIFELIGVKEILLFEAILFSIIWLNDEYFATLITAIFSPIFIGIYIVSVISEKLEATKVPRNYFSMILGLGIVPIFVLVIAKLLLRV